MPSDFKQPKRIRDPELMNRLHLSPGTCPLCLDLPAMKQLPVSLHHVLPKGSPHHGDDLAANLVWLCGSGTTGHHGQVEAHDALTCLRLGEHLLAERPDTLAYLTDKLGPDAADAWLERHLHVRLP